MLKASLGLSWSFFRTPASHRLGSACSGTWHHARLQQWEFWRRPAQLKMRLVPTFGTAVLRGKAHTMKMENLDAVLRGQNLISMSWRCTGLWRCWGINVPLLNNKQEEHGLAESKECRMCEAHTDTSPGCSSKIQQFMAQEITIFFFLLMQMGFLFHEFVQSLLDVNFQHPQHPLGKSYSLCVLWKKPPISFGLANC